MFTLNTSALRFGLHDRNLPCRRVAIDPGRDAEGPPGVPVPAQAHPGSDGMYKVQGLPAGEYYVCALTDLDPNDLYDPAFLEQLVAASFKITLADGETKVQNLKLGGGSN